MVPNGGSGSSGTPSLSNFTNSQSSDVLLNSTSTYFDGPSVAQGATGTWFASGTVTLFDSAAAGIDCKLWDGTTVIDSGSTTIPPTILVTTMTLSGVLATPAGNIRISCKDKTATTGKIFFNNSTNSKDSTISVVRIQ